MSLFDVIRNAMLAGFGMQEKVKDFIDDLVKKGELSESQGAKLVKEWSEKFEKNTEEVGKNISESVSKALEKMKLATKEDIGKLNEKIDSLGSRISKIEESKKE
ncbi:MAG: phasin family protein [Acidobacteriota bacterium]|nr:phasin family protein [Nitrospiraceae bacterium]